MAFEDEVVRVALWRPSSSAIRKKVFESSILVSVDTVPKIAMILLPSNLMLLDGAI